MKNKFCSAIIRRFTKVDFDQELPLVRRMTSGASHLSSNGESWTPACRIQAEPALKRSLQSHKLIKSENWNGRVLQ